MGPGLQILPSSQGSQADPTVQDGPCIPWGQGAHGGPAVPAAELPGPGPPGLPPRGPCHHHCCQTGMGASEMYQEDQEVRLIQGALPGQGGPSRQGLQLGLGSPGCQGVQLTPLGLLGLEVPLQTYQAPALQALPSLPLAPGVHGQPADNRCLWSWEEPWQWRKLGVGRGEAGRGLCQSLQLERASGLVRGVPAWLLTSWQEG